MPPEHLIQTCSGGRPVRALSSLLTPWVKKTPFPSRYERGKRKRAPIPFPCAIIRSAAAKQSSHFRNFAPVLPRPRLFAFTFMLILSHGEQIFIIVFVFVSRLCCFKTFNKEGGQWLSGLSLAREYWVVNCDYSVLTGDMGRSLSMTTAMLAQGHP